MSRLICLGDSNTFGYDPQSFFGGRYPKNVRWTGRLESAGRSVVNRGLNGLPVCRESLHAVYAEELKTGAPADLLTVMLGSNDLLMGLSAKETAASMEKLLSCLIPEQTAGRILLLSPPVFRPGVWVEGPEQIEKSRQLGGLYGELAGQLGTLFADTAGWEIPLAFDGVHFTAEGHVRFAQHMEELLRTLDL